MSAFVLLLFSSIIAKKIIKIKIVYYTREACQTGTNSP
jgi:hypothetical protein